MIPGTYFNLSTSVRSTVPWSSRSIRHKRMMRPSAIPRRYGAEKIELQKMKRGRIPDYRVNLYISYDVVHAPALLIDCTPINAAWNITLQSTPCLGFITTRHNSSVNHFKAKSPSVSDDRLPPPLPDFPFGTTGVADAKCPPSLGVLGRGVSFSPLEPTLPFELRLRFFCRPGVSPPPNGVLTVCRRASFAASARAAGVEGAAAPLRDSRDRPFPGVLPPPGVAPPASIRAVPGVRRPVPGVLGVSGVPTAGVRFAFPSAASPSFARLRRVSTASRRCASLSRGGRSLTSNFCPSQEPPTVAAMLAKSTAPPVAPSGRGVARGSRIIGVPSIDPHVICGESPSTPCTKEQEQRTREGDNRTREGNVGSAGGKPTHKRKREQVFSREAKPYEMVARHSGACARHGYTSYHRLVKNIRSLFRSFTGKASI